MSLPRSVLAFAFLAASLSGAAMAQDSEPNQLVFNPQVGINATQYNTDKSVAETDARIGWQVGVSLRYGKRFQFQPGVFYQLTSVEISGLEDTELEDVQAANGVSSIWVPMEVGFDIIQNDLLTLRAHGGVAGTFVTSVNENELGLTKDDFKSFRAGGVLGAGVDIAIVSVDLSYEFGLTEVFETPEGEDGISDTKANTARLSAGLKF